MHPQMQRMQVGPQVQEDSACYGATKLRGRNSCADALASESRSY